LVQSDLSKATLLFANLSRADLRNAHLNGADFREANMTDADLRDASIARATLIETHLERADLRGCLIYGIAAWDLYLEGTIQSNLIISPHQPVIQVDDIEIAQFIYLLLNNRKIRQVIETITSKIVLILGRFTAERKTVLEAIREHLRYRNYLPVLFDFEKPVNRDLTETISTLAHMARFVIADITDAKSIGQELMAIVPYLPSVPVQPLLLASQPEYEMFEHFRQAFPMGPQASPLREPAKFGGGIGREGN
jgi:uncharacterized protein YjbI with pentapeptide repeats